MYLKQGKLLIRQISRGFARQNKFFRDWQQLKEEKMESYKTETGFDELKDKIDDDDYEIVQSDYFTNEDGISGTYKNMDLDLKQRKYEQFLESKMSIKEKIEDYMNQAKDDSEIYLRSDKFIESTRKGDLSSLFIDDKSSLINEYKRYDYYKKNYISKKGNKQMNIKKETERERDQQGQSEALLNGFFDDLNPKFTEKLNTQHKVHTIRGLELLTLIERNMDSVDSAKEDMDDNDVKRNNTKKDYIHMKKTLNKIFEKNINRGIDDSKVKDIEKKIIKAYDEPIKEIDHQIEEEEDDEEEMDMDDQKGNAPSYQMSLKSRLEMYRLYVEGWSIKDLCIRFGVSPRRAKFSLWGLQYFLEDVLPFITPEKLIELIYIANNPPGNIQIVDYGADLDELQEFKTGEGMTFLSKKQLDQFPRTYKENEITEEEVREEMRKMEQRKEDFVVEMYQSKKVLPYKLKNWVVHDGPGELKVNKMFKKIIERSHYKGHLPHKVTRSLEKGPRIASKGFGHE